MYAVEVYAAGRRFVFVDGKSRREAAKVFGPSLDMIQKICTFSAPPGYQCTKPPTRPRLDPFIALIDAMLAGDKTAPPKHGHTEAWHEMIGDPTYADAILDRIIHAAHRVKLGGRSIRDNTGDDAA